MLALPEEKRPISVSNGKAYFCDYYWLWQSAED